MKNVCFFLFMTSLALISCDNGEHEAVIENDDKLHNYYSISPLVSTLHYRNGNNIVGDVIPFYHEGEYHVFFLQGDEWARIVSTDLVNWRVLPLAISKGSTTDDPDDQGIWTG